MLKNQFFERNLARMRKNKYLCGTENMGEFIDIKEVLRYRIMRERIEELLQEARQTADSLGESAMEAAEQFRLQFLSKKGKLNTLFDAFKTVPAEHKKEVGMALNQLKQSITSIYDDLKSKMADAGPQASKMDLTMSAENIGLGSRHPIAEMRNEICRIFGRLGFTIAEGPEIEDDWHVFSALNFAEDHPARDMQDTFFIDKQPDILLRTHTSSVQVRVMENQKPPIRMIMPGRVFRNEAISARAHCIFHQIEGLSIAEGVSFADLKQTLLFFVHELFGEDRKIRLRPSYFPFTEPSAEMDVSCSCGGKGCPLCKGTGWLEVMGCGMVDPNVLKLCGIDPDVYSGFAFGMGLERLAFLRYQIKDIRMYFENDVRFLEQFSSAGI